ncbi:MAG: exosortase O [Microcoleaceae cyanobacterium]
MATDVRLSPGVQPESVQSRAFSGLAILAYATIVLSWLYFNRLPLQWLAQAFPSLSVTDGLRLTGIGLFLVLAGYLLRDFLQVAVERTKAWFRPLTAKAVPLAPFVTILGCGLFSLLSQWFITLEQLPAIYFLLGSYGLLGLWLKPDVWHRGLAVAVAMSCVIPFGIEFSTNLGFPARILTAEAVEQILHHLNISALSSEDIIVLDTGIAQVELPCSGLKSLWIGTLFFLGATALDRRQLGWRWLGVGAIHLGLLILANIARVLSLVMIAEVLQQPEMAAILHVPLGLIGFTSVCIISYGLLLRRVPSISTTSQDVNRRQLKVPSIILAAGLVGLVLCPTAPRLGSQLPNLQGMTWPTAIQTETIPFSEAEVKFFQQHSDTLTQKQQFHYKNLSGSVLFVAGSTWRSQHAPELCLVSSGYQLNQMESRPLTPEVTGRWLTLNQETQSGAYWFQSPTTTTDAFIHRIWSEVTRQESSWTLVSVLFDESVQPEQPMVQELLTILQAELTRSYTI